MLEKPQPNRTPRLQSSLHLSLFGVVGVDRAHLVLVMAGLELLVGDPLGGSSGSGLFEHLVDLFELKEESSQSSKRGLLEKCKLTVKPLVSGTKMRA